MIRWLTLLGRLAPKDARSLAIAANYKEQRTRPPPSPTFSELIAAFPDVPRHDSPTLPTHQPSQSPPLPIANPPETDLLRQIMGNAPSSVMDSLVEGSNCTWYFMGCGKWDGSLRRPIDARWAPKGAQLHEWLLTVVRMNSQPRRGRSPAQAIHEARQGSYQRRGAATLRVQDGRGTDNRSRHDRITLGPSSARSS